MAVSRERPTPWDRRDAAPVCITVSAVVVGVIEELVVDPAAVAAAAAAAAAVAVAEAVTVGAVNVPFPVALGEVRVPNPIWPLSKSKTEYTFFKKTSPTSQSLAPDD